MNPGNGGMPASESMATAIVTAAYGLRPKSPLRLSSRSRAASSAAPGSDANASRFMSP